MNNTNDNKIQILVEILDLETKIIYSVILALILGIFLYNIFVV